MSAPVSFYVIILIIINSFVSNANQLFRRDVENEFVDSCVFPINHRNMNSTRSRLNDVVSLHYDNRLFACVDCMSSYGVRTLIRKQTSNFRLTRETTDTCKSSCNGILCGINKTCVDARNLSNSSDSAVTVRRCKGSIRIKSPASIPRTPRKSNNQIPLIIGFAVGGIMLAVVIAGVFLGRSRSNSSPEASVATTPVSMSYSEWISNYSTGGRGSNMCNLRVQETDNMDGQMDNLAVPVYNIVYEENDKLSVAQVAHKHDAPTIIEIDESDPLEDDMTQQCKQGNYLDYVDDFQLDDYTPNQNYIQANYNVDSSMFVDDMSFDIPEELYSGKEPQSHVHSRCDSIEMTQQHRHDVLPHNAITGRIEEHRRLSMETTWSDESEYERINMDECGKSFMFRNNNQEKESVKSFLARSSLPTCQHLNLSNLTHVFADVHHSMACSIENIRNENIIEKKQMPSDNDEHTASVHGLNQNDFSSRKRDCKKYVGSMKCSQRNSNHYTI